MKKRLKIGEKRTFKQVICEKDLAVFDTGTVHKVCSTFTLAKLIEWTSRLFIIDIKTNDEEGIGTMLHIDHKNPAFLNQELLIEAKVLSINGNKLICNVIVTSGNSIIAKAKTGQKLLKKDKIKQIFSSLANSKN